MFKAIASALNVINAPLARLTAHISGMLLLVMTLIVMTQVISRYVLNAPISWVDEASRFLMIYMTYLCLPMIYLDNKNIAMTFVTDKLKYTRIYELFMIFGHLASLALFAVWVYYGWAFLQRGSVSADTMPVPMYVVYVIPPVMLAISCSFALQKLFTSLHNFVTFDKEAKKAEEMAALANNNN
ncbi:TRAP transporter small permease [Vibrio sp.]|nr:TRAP transporter small permease [Vibrio sp.]